MGLGDNLTEGGLRASPEDSPERSDAISLDPGASMLDHDNDGSLTYAADGPLRFRHDDEYKKKREKNNEAVRKSRQKTKKKTMETAKRVEALKRENDNLEERAKTLNRELAQLKEMFCQRYSDGKGASESGENA